MRNLIKGCLLTVMAISLFACGPALSKKYEESSKEEDLSKIAKEISPKDFELLKSFIIESTGENKDLSRYSYNALLMEATIMGGQREKERQAEQKKKEDEKAIRQKMELLCAKKWKIKEYAYQKALLDTSEEGVEFAKMMFKRGFSEAHEPQFSIKERPEGTVLMVIFDEAMTNVLTGNKKRRKIYSMDGTYKEVDGNKVVAAGTWKFIAMNKIQEKRPSPKKDSVDAKEQGDMFILNIDYLDGNAFSFSEWHSATATYNTSGANYYVIMESVQ